MIVKYWKNGEKHGGFNPHLVAGHKNIDANGACLIRELWAYRH